MSDESYLTADGADRLRAELEHLKNNGRTALAARLRTAIQQGDLSENADYIAAKEEQGFLEGRIQELELILRNAIIVEENDGPRDSVELGVWVTVQEEEAPPEKFRLVGASEANPREGLISNESPIGSALLGRRIGEEVSAQTPGGIIKMRILKIE